MKKTNNKRVTGLCRTESNSSVIKLEMSMEDDFLTPGLFFSGSTVHSLSLPLLMKHFSVIWPKKLGQKAEPANGSRRSQRPSTEENEWVIYTTGLPDAANQIFFRNQICKFSFIDHFLFAQLHNLCHRIINLTTDTGFNR